MLRQESSGRWGISAAIAFMLCCTATRADESEFFETRIRPLLIARCYECHSAGTEQNGGLSLDSKPGWEHGGDSGPAVVAGDPETSRLIKAVRWNDAELKMPPEDAGGKLAASEIADLEAWVKAGAFDPRTEAPVAEPRQSWAETFEERRAWWSLQPVQNPPVPDVAVTDWNATAIDRFLFDRMTSAGLEPAALASPETQIRRVTLVLIGLPPTVDEVTAYVAESQLDRKAAYERLVERLLASPHFGERFARHWMDVVRFTETHGNEWNYDVPYAWRYRDYLIRAFNDDLPYDGFVREHIAGDLLAEIRRSPDGKRNESVIGTAFYRFGEVSHDSCVLFTSIGYDIADSQVDTLTKAFQATTVACARCHDHKLDAVSTRDYHALLGILRSSRCVQHTLDSPEVNGLPMADLSNLKEEIREELKAVWLGEAKALDAAKLNALLAAAGGNVAAATDPLYGWSRLTETAKSLELTLTDDANSSQAVAESWRSAAAAHAAVSAENAAFNAATFRTVTDFRTGGDTRDWLRSGMGLRDNNWLSGDISVAPEGDAAIRNILPAGVFTFGLSDRLNGVLRSPPLKRTHSKMSFEVIGGGFSLARLVFNNCQLNYTNQHSIHHPHWAWVTVDFQEGTDELHPYAELATLWDNPKFPDPLGTLSKDTENQRLPYNDHAKNARSWWGVRRVVAHDSGETPRDEAAFIVRLFDGNGVISLDQAAAAYSAVATRAVERCATDEDVAWVEWLLTKGVLANRADANPRLAELIAKYRDIESHQLQLPTMIPGMADEYAGFDQPVLARGDFTKPGEVVPRRYLEAVADAVNSGKSDNSGGIWNTSVLPAGHLGSGRAMVAETIVGDDNPLTARVMVNRIWQWTFGSGLVRTPDNFGHVGDLPSHPELLDHLATRFADEKWSIKAIIRAIVLSRAFQSSAAPAQLSRAKDPDNVWLSWYPARRAEAEVIRDNILAVSGRLDATQFGPSVHPYRATADTEKRLYTGPLDGDGRRSLYIKFQLMEPTSFLSAFNLPGGKETQGRRDASNVPAQSLALLNDPFVLAMADYWATRLIMENSATTVESRAEQMFLKALGRSPNTTELNRFVKAIENFAGIEGVGNSNIMISQPVWKEAAHALFNFKEFIFVP